MSDPMSPLDPTAVPGGAAPPPAPRWVKVAGVVALLLLLAFVVRHVIAGGIGNHGGS